jgi:hypothetical protein
VKKSVLAVAVILLALSAMAAPAFAAQNSREGIGESSTTTLDACGYFVGTETLGNIRTTTSGGVTTTLERGTWVGVSNNYGNGPVSSLGSVSGGYVKETKTYPDGSITGTEMLNSRAGKIDQVFSFNPTTGWTVSVVATRDLAFLTSNTSGECYTGPFPRP